MDVATRVDFHNPVYCCESVLGFFTGTPWIDWSKSEAVRATCEIPRVEVSTLAGGAGEEWHSHPLSKDNILVMDYLAKR